MREIKFRAWDKEKKEMVQVLKMNFMFETIEGIMVEGYDNHTIDHIIMPENLILMQYTGLKDSKRTEEYPEGQEIYEGSTVKAWIYGDEEPQILDVRWHASGGFVIDYRDAESDMVLVGDFVGSLEVIGNIYEGES